MSSAQACINNLRHIDTACLLYNLGWDCGSAVQTFVTDQKARGHPVPEAVTLHELLAGGYLPNSTDAAKFNEAVVTFSTKANQTNLKAVWISIRYSDDFEIRMARNGAEISAGYASRWW